jgi:uncharacterized protein YprB with RNaseH-like and TPR domain
MLDEAFLHLNGIGPKKLEKIKELGIKNWDEFLERIAEISRGEKRKLKLQESLFQSKFATEKQDLHYLAKVFHSKDKWRILEYFEEDLSFFDIETDGLYNRITVICCLHKQQNYTFVRGENLNEFLDFLDDVKLLVSFNGNSFDIPTILRHFHISKFPVPHIDLRWVLYQAGIKGSLKEIEKYFGITRDPDISEIDGQEAVYLWFRYQEWGEQEAKQKLIKYCHADVNSLKILTKEIISLNKKT